MSLKAASNVTIKKTMQIIETDLVGRTTADERTCPPKEHQTTPESTV